MNAAFFSAVRTSLFGGSLNQTQVDSINEIAKAFGQYGDGDRHKLAYLLATAHHETGRFRWLRELWGPTAAQRRYEGRADLGNTQPGDGKRFMGRGFVHVTGRRNYADWARRLGVDIVANPELAGWPDIAARILVEGCMLGTFTGRKLGDYIAPPRVDFVNARRVVNGTDKADLIAGYARKYLAALDLDPPVTQPRQPDDPGPVTTPDKPMPSATKVAGIGAAILALIVAIATALGVDPQTILNAIGG